MGRESSKKEKGPQKKKKLHQLHENKNKMGGQNAEDDFSFKFLFIHGFPYLNYMEGISDR